MACDFPTAEFLIKTMVLVETILMEITYFSDFDNSLRCLCYVT